MFNLSRVAHSGACCLLLLASAAGCGEVRYGMPTTRDEVLSTSVRPMPGDGVKAEAWQQATELRVRATRRCDLAEYNEIRRISHQEAEADHELSAVVLGVSAVPLTMGVILLADSPAVHEEDRNAREYNPVGPEGAIAAGVILMVVGTVLAVAPTVEMIRTSGSLEEESIVHDWGRVLKSDVRCGTREPASGVAVVGRLMTRVDEGDAVQVPLGLTDGSGRLTVDLAAALEPSMVAAPRRSDSMELWVGDRMVGLIDLGPVRRAQRHRTRHPDGVLLPEEQPPLIPTPTPDDSKHGPACPGEECP